MHPIHVDGMHDGKRVRYSLDIFSWEEASRKLLEIESGAVKQAASTVSAAIEDYIVECERRKLSTEGIRKYREMLAQLDSFCESRAITTVRALDYATLLKFVGTLEDSSLTIGKKIERLRTFMRHCNDMGWIDSNPATKIKKPKVMNPPVVPIEPEEHAAIHRDPELVLQKLVYATLGCGSFSRDLVLEVQGLPQSSQSPVCPSSDRNRQRLPGFPIN
jgi:hypothetical protein